MASERKLPLVVRFGPFEADLNSGELLRSGAKVKLQDQPFQVLVSLLERAGQVVTREELRQKVWQADTFVDFERGLNKAINRLRESLGDSAEKPKFIETLPRKGYRFIGPVTRSIRSLAVLPLDNLSGDPNLEHWADGITDEMITHVAKIVDLRVISRTSIMRFKRFCTRICKSAHSTRLCEKPRIRSSWLPNAVPLRANSSNPCTHVLFAAGL